MKVRIKKIKYAWNGVHDGEFSVGDIVDIQGNVVTTKTGKKFDGRDLTKCFSNRCSYPDIFDKIIEHPLTT